MLARCRSLIDADRAGEALEVLQTLTDEDPDDADAWCLAANAFRALGDRQRCYWASECALQADPYSSGGYDWMVRAHLAFGDAKSALETAHKGVEMTHGETASRRTLVGAFLAANETAEAEMGLRALAQLAPHDPELIAHHAEVYRQRGQHSEALAWHQHALAVDPRCEAAWAGLGHVHASGGRNLEAGESYHRAGELSPMDFRYRAGFLEQMEELHRRSGIGAVLFTLHLMCRVIPAVHLLLLPLFSLLWDGPIHRKLVARRVGAVAPHLRQPYLHRARLYDAEIIPRFPWLWAVVLLVIACAIASSYNAVELLAHVILVVGLLTAWGWSRYRARRLAAGLPQPNFWFPWEDRPEGKEAPPPPDADLEDFAWWQLWNRKPERARVLARQVLAADPESVSALITFAVASLAVGRIDEANAAAVSARSQEPEETRTLSLLWLSMAARGKLPLVMEHANADPLEALAGAHYLSIYARALRAAGAAQGAELAERLIRETAPDSPEERALAGTSALRAGKSREAEAAYREALREEPESAEYTTCLGRALAAQGRLIQAWRLWLQALRLDPKRKPALHLLELYVRRAVVAGAAAFALIAAAVGAYPTLVGATTNRWMWIASVNAPLPISILVAGLHWLSLRRLPFLLPEPGFKSFRSIVIAAFRPAALLLVTCHAAQSWLEIALHPELLAPRWLGALTATSVVAIGWGWAFPSIRSEIRDDSG
jgi:tetratricopeptide (TPR) repeat protein